MTAPDRIWAWTWNLPNNPKHQGWQEWVREDPPKSQDAPEYIRADLHAALQAENERLRNANAMWVINFENVFAEGAKAQGESDRFRAALESIRDTMDITGAESIARAALK